MKAQGPFEYILLGSGALVLALTIFLTIIMSTRLAEPISRLGRLVLWSTIP